MSVVTRERKYFGEVLRKTQDLHGDERAGVYLSCPLNVNRVVNLLSVKASEWFVNKVCAVAQLAVHKGVTLTDELFIEVCNRQHFRWKQADHDELTRVSCAENTLDNFGYETLR